MALPTLKRTDPLIQTPFPTVKLVAPTDIEPEVEFNTKLFLLILSVVMSHPAIEPVVAVTWPAAVTLNGAEAGVPWPAQILTTEPVPALDNPTCDVPVPPVNFS